jgi:hypothetical protein
VSYHSGTVAATVTLGVSQIVCLSVREFVSKPTLEHSDPIFFKAMRQVSLMNSAPIIFLSILQYVEIA